MNLIKKGMEEVYQWQNEGVLADLTSSLNTGKGQAISKSSIGEDKPKTKKSGGDRFIPLRSINDDNGRLEVLSQKENQLCNIQGKQGSQIDKNNKPKRKLLQFTCQNTYVCKEEEYLQDLAVKGLIRINKSAKKAIKTTRKAEKVLDAPGLVNDYYLNLIDWGKNNLLAVCLGEGAFVWNPSTQDGHQFFTSDSSLMIPTAIGWSPNVVFELPRMKT